MLMYSLLSWPILVMLFSLPGLWAFHFQQIPATVTAFLPQSIYWSRDATDIGTQTIIFGCVQQPAGPFSTVVGSTTVDDTQREGTITITIDTTAYVTPVA